MSKPENEPENPTPEDDENPEVLAHDAEDAPLWCIIDSCGTNTQE